jgi:hypothetical protein
VNEVIPYRIAVANRHALFFAVTTWSGAGEDAHFSRKKGLRQEDVESPTLVQVRHSGTKVTHANGHIQRIPLRD